MPVTPYHLGPGLLLKGAARRHFSFAAFTAVQVIIDVESGTNLVLRRTPVHHHLHTLIGSLLVAACVTALAPFVFTRINRWARARREMPAWIASELTDVTWIAAATGALLGGVSHVLLDAVMHADLVPFAPWLAGNPLQSDEAWVALHLGCVISGMLGAVLWLVPHTSKRRRD